MTLVIHSPPTNIPERKYIYQVLLDEFLGLMFRVQFEERGDVRITLDGDLLPRELILRDAFFQTPETEWLKPASLPDQPLEVWDIARSQIDIAVVSPRIPVIYGASVAAPGFFKAGDSAIKLGLDIFGSSFFMLTRYEEAVKTERDLHNRFPAGASLAFQEGFIDRPLINEYLEILWWCLKKLWPLLERKPRTFEVILTHDVDSPFGVAFTPLFHVFKSWAGDLLKRKNPVLFWQRAKSWFWVNKGLFDQDLNYCFGTILDISEQNNLRSAFYFITGRAAGSVDGFYSIDNPWIRRLMGEIHERGHEIGLHPGYNSFCDAALVKREFDLLLRTCAAENIYQAAWGGRQHFLRWEAATTWQHWEDAGLNYDSTLSFADHPGFRCGVCYDYPVFNLVRREPLKLRERPLIVMEASLLRYMNMPPAGAFEEISKLKSRCKLFQGMFTLLWHNHFLITDFEKQFYSEVIKQIAL